MTDNPYVCTSFCQHTHTDGAVASNRISIDLLLHERICPHWHTHTNKIFYLFFTPVMFFFLSVLEGDIFLLLYFLFSNLGKVMIEWLNIRMIIIERDAATGLLTSLR